MRSVGFEGSPAHKAKNRKALCHPERKHLAKGMCAKCYKTAYNHKHYLKNPHRLPRQVSIVRTAFKELVLTGSFCSFCTISFNPNMKPLGAKTGICSMCEADIIRGANMKVEKEVDMRFHSLAFLLEHRMEIVSVPL